MLSLIYLAVAILAGLVLVKRFLPDLPPMVRLGGGFFVGDGRLAADRHDRFACRQWGDRRYVSASSQSG